jgi:hypothetical protein
MFPRNEKAPNWRWGYPDQKNKDFDLNGPSTGNQLNGQHHKSQHEKDMDQIADGLTGKAEAKGPENQKNYH